VSSPRRANAEPVVPFYCAVGQLPACTAGGRQPSVNDLIRAQQKRRRDRQAGGFAVFALITSSNLVGWSILDDDILSLDVAQLAQALAEWPHEMGLEGRRGVPDEPYPVNSPRRLRLGGERRDEEQNGHDGSDRRAHAKALK